jgi:hypothetical protein
MPGGASLQPHQARRKTGEIAQNLAAAKLPPHHDRARESTP